MAKKASKAAVAAKTRKKMINKGLPASVAAKFAKRAARKAKG